MSLAYEQTTGRYAARWPSKRRRMREWRITELLGDLDVELARVLPEWERQVKATLPVERKPAAVWEWNKALMADPKITKTMLAVAFTIGTYADSKTGETTFVTDATVGEAVGIRRQQVSPYRQTLKQAGYLLETSRRPGGSVTYRLTVPVC